MIHEIEVQKRGWGSCFFFPNEESVCSPPWSDGGNHTFLAKGFHVRAGVVQSLVGTLRGETNVQAMSAARKVTWMAGDRVVVQRGVQLGASTWPLRGLIAASPVLYMFSFPRRLFRGAAVASTGQDMLRLGRGAIRCRGFREIEKVVIGKGGRPDDTTLGFS